jgi:hypothetical protein
MTNHCQGKLYVKIIYVSLHPSPGNKKIPWTKTGINYRNQHILPSEGYFKYHRQVSWLMTHPTLSAFPENPVVLADFIVIYSSGGCMGF